MDSVRIRTTPNGADKYVKLKLEQDFDFIEILSLKISQDRVYETFCSDYGVVVGRVIVNNGFGVPNAKVSIFIPIDENDKLNSEIYSLYPYENVNDKNVNGLRYNLLPKENVTQDDCYTPVGSFPTKREILDNNELLSIYKKYYKYTTVTNHAGDFMLFGVPVGNHVLHVDVDISDIGVASQKPYDMIDQGTPERFFDTTTKFKSNRNLNTLMQVKSMNIGVNVQPFWGDLNNCEIGITRADFDLNYTLRPCALFVGGIFGDSEKNSINKQCRPRKDMGSICEQITQEGTIEMLRKTIDDQIERFDVEGGRVIDSNGAWAYQIPMNLDFMVTDEFGNLIPSSDENIGIPTRTRVRFRIGMDETGSNGRLRTRGKYLIPHNPDKLSDLDFSFDKSTKDSSFTDLYWNKIYSVKNFISRVQKANIQSTNNFTGIKDVDACTGDKNPFPFNRAYTRSNVLFTIICFIITLITGIVYGINTVLCFIKNIRIVGIRPFKGINPIRVKCPSDPERFFYPGCNDTIDAYTDCVSAVLANEFNLYRLDFYNDWINGSLYFYLLKYKRKRRGNEKFCETYCNDYGGGTGVNSCSNNQLMDTTVEDQNDRFSRTFRNGMLVKYEDQLYYPPILLNGSNMKLFATDIINLGSKLDCDWQGFPKIIQYLTSTSYNIPPLIQEIDDDGSSVSGLIQIGNLYTGLFFDIGCGGVSYDRIKATNIRRQSEIGVDVPESDIGAPKNVITIEQIYNTSDQIESLTSSSRYLRDSYYLLNINGSDISSLPINNTLLQPSFGTSFGFRGSSSPLIHDNGVAYNNFRKYSVNHNGQPSDMSFQSWGNSFYFYFGLIPGRTGFDKLINKYFVQCERITNNEYIIDVNVTDVTQNNGNNGAIDFRIIGGSAPFTITITGENYEFGPFTFESEGRVTNLMEGIYILSVTDNLGLIVTREIVVNGPLPLSCGYMITNQPSTVSSNDGSITLSQLIGGIGPYNLNIVGPNLNTTINNVNVNSTNIRNLVAGLYTLTITDSSLIPETCQQTIELIGNPPLTLTNVTVTNVGCDDNCDGSIDISVSGGKLPYTLSATGPNNYNISGDLSTIQLIGLCEGTYNLTIEDSVGQTISTSRTLTKSIAPSINLVGINNKKQCNPSLYTIRFNLVFGSAQNGVKIYYNIDGIDYEQTGVNGLNTLLISQLITTVLTIYVDDGQCISNTLTIPVSEITRPTTQLLLGGNRVGNTITYSATGGIAPYTFMPVNNGSFNVYTAPSSQPVVGIVTDNVGCTSSKNYT